MNRFLQDVARTLEVGSVGLDARFRETPGWCSLHAFGLLVLLENDWQTPISIDALGSLNSVRDLLREVVLSFAARQFGVSRQEVSPETAYGTVPAWDSVGHIRLVMAFEERFGVKFPMERIPALLKLNDFIVDIP